MKTKAKTLICSNQYLLRTIEDEDAEVLRIWKNEHKEFFFYKKDITVEEQEVWVKSLYEKENDFMFIVLENNKPIGCIGVRLLNENIDIYNVILGDKNYKGKHIMKNALWAIVSFSNLIFKNKPIFIKVLENNPAINWYKKIGFETIEIKDEYLVMEFKNFSFEEKYNFEIYITLTKN